MSLCLSMIVRDEAHVIERCLASVLPVIDAWAIVDTGSTDDTVGVIERFFARAKIPGSVYLSEWRNFGANRTEALELARRTATTHSLTIDADETLEFASGCEALRSCAGDCVELRHFVPGASFWLPKVTRNALPFRYEGVLHEYLTCASAYDLGRLSGFAVRGHFDSARNRLTPEVKYSLDARVLERELATDPDNARNWFYLGQSYRDARCFERAAEAYRKRIRLGGWEEEIWYARYQLGACLERMGQVAEARASYLEAVTTRKRAEPRLELARLAVGEGDWYAARDWARRAVECPFPVSDRLFVSEDVYTWRARDALAVANYWCGDRAACAAICWELLAGDLPASERERVQKNLDYCARNPT